MSSIPLCDRAVTGPAVAAFNLAASAYDRTSVCALLAACDPADRSEVCAWLADETGASWSPELPRTIWILGAPDAEMTAIESLLRECGQSVHYALAASGRRVAPGQPAVTYEGVPEVPPHELIAIEVAGPWGAPAIDHHDGSERASWGPERFLGASSLGQVIALLAVQGLIPWGLWPGWSHLSAGLWGGNAVRVAMVPGDFVRLSGHGLWGVVGAYSVSVVPRALVFEAAADHCPAAAIKGLCPGVDPGAFAPFLAESKRRQYFPAMSAEDFARELKISRATLLAAPPVTELVEPWASERFFSSSCSLSEHTFPARAMMERAQPSPADPRAHEVTMAMPMPPIPLCDRPVTGPAVAAFDLRACFDGPAVGALLAACRPEDRDEVVAWIRDETGCSWAADTQPDGRRP